MLIGPYFLILITTYNGIRSKLDWKTIIGMDINSLMGLLFLMQLRLKV